MKNFVKLLLTSVILLSNIFLPQSSLAQCKLQFDMTKWEVVALEDFNGTELNSALWQTRPRNTSQTIDRLSGWGSEWYDDADPSLVTVSGGSAHLKATRWLDSSGNPKEQSVTTLDGTRTVRYRSGMLLSKTNPESFGAFEARIKLPAYHNAWPAFWLWSCPTEIDILDGVYDYSMLTNVIDNRRSSTNQNGNTCNGDHMTGDHLTDPRPVLSSCGRLSKLWSWSNEWVPTLLSSNYHLYSMVWTPDQVSIFLDGREIRTVPRSAVATLGRTKDDRPYYSDVIISLQMYPWSYENIDSYMDVDYIRMLKPKAGTNGRRDYATVPPSSYKSDHQFINHDVSVTGVPPQARERPGIMMVHSDAASIAINSNNPNQVFYRGTDEKMYLATNSSGTWSLIQLPSVPGGGVYGDVTYHAGLDCILYKGEDYQIQAYYYEAGMWKHTWITSPANPSDLVVKPWPQGNIAVRTSDNCIVYVGLDHQLHYCYPGSPYWSVTTITTTDQYATVDNNIMLEQGTKNIFYRGSDGRLQYYWWTGTDYAHAWVDTNWNTSDYTISHQPHRLNAFSNLGEQVFQIVVVPA